MPNQRRAINRPAGVRPIDRHETPSMDSGRALRHAQGRALAGPVAVRFLATLGMTLWGRDSSLRFASLE